MKRDRITIRAGRRSDRPYLVAFTKNTFHWGDYIPEVIDKWTRSKEGKLLVAEVSGRAIGMIHVAFLDEREAWMEGMRVHPDFRRCGVGRQLDRAALAVAKREGFRIARLETASDNHKAQAALERFGYHFRVQYREWVSRTRHSAAGRARLAKLSELPALLNLWEHSWMKRASKGIVPLRSGWRWGQLTSARLGDLIEGRSVWVTPENGIARAFSVLRSNDSEELVCLVGSASFAQVLLEAVRSEASRKGKKECYLLLPDSRMSTRYATMAGFKLRYEGLLIYEQAL